MTESHDPRGMPGFDMEALLQTAQQMGEQMMAAQAEAASAEYEGHAGGGAVTITVTGDMTFTSVTIDPDVVDPGDVEMLEDLVLAALRDAVDKASDADSGGADFAGLDLGALTGGMDLGALMGGLGGGMPGLAGAIDVGAPDAADDDTGGDGDGE